MSKALDHEAASPQRILWDDLAKGGLGLAVGFSAIGVEILRNYTYGLGEGIVVAFTFALFAVGLGVIPVIATAQRWTPALIVLLTMCFAVTGYCGMQYYAGKLAAKLNAAESASMQYRDARQAIEAARAELAAARAEIARIGELMSPAELQRLYEDADARARAEASDPKRGARCGEACRKAEAERDAYSPRIAAAKAREAAQSRAEAAQARVDAGRSEAKSGDTEANLLASLLADRFGGEAGAIARYLDLGVSAALVLGMLFFAALVGPSLALVMKSLRGEDDQTVRAPAEPSPATTAEPVTEADTAQPAPNTTARKRTLTAEQRIERFIAKHVARDEGGDGIRSGPLYAEFCTWWVCHAPGQPTPSQRSFALAMAAKGYVSVKRGGVQRYANARLAAWAIE